MWPFNWFLRLLRDVKDAWRDIKELTAPHRYEDIQWIDRRGEERDNGSSSNDTSQEHSSPECGKCDRCDRPVWYKITHTSAGYPISGLYCEHCAWDLVNSSPHILECHITSARRRWLRKNRPEGQ